MRVFVWVYVCVKVGEIERERESALKVTIPEKHARNFLSLQLFLYKSERKVEINGGRLRERRD